MSLLRQFALLLAAAVFSIAAGAVVAAPTFQALGNAVGGTGNVNVQWPAHQAGDVALLFIESGGGQAANLSTPSGFVEVANSPQATGGGPNGTRLTVYWARATISGMANVAVSDPGNHVYARILTYRGVVGTGDPWDVTGGDVKSGASTSVTVTGVTTTVPDTLIVQAVARDNDNAGAAFSNQTNPNLTGIAERSDAGTTQGNGGGIGIWDGVFAGPGATGDTTATVTNSINAFLTIALRAPAEPEIVSASLICGTTDQVQVVFSRAVTLATAENIANYALDGGATIGAASLDATGQVVTLTTGTLELGQLYTLTVNNVVSTAGGVIAPNSQATFYSEGGYLAGLQGSYFANMTLTGTPAGTRIDGPVDFDWGVGAPGVGGIGTDGFSVRWTGFVTPTVSGSYTFRTRSDDGVRLYLDGALIIDNWTDHAPTDNDSAPVALNAGQRYAVVMEYYENGGGAVAQLSWSGPATGGFQFIPRANLSHFCGLPQPVAFYRLDESAWVGAGDVADSSGFNRHGTAQGGATPVPAQVCNGVQLDGAARYVSVPNLSTVLNQTASLAFWIRTTQTGNDTGWQAPGVSGVELAGGADDIFWGWIDASGRIGVSVANDYTTKSTIAINDGNWRHVVLTRDHMAGTYGIYIDGALNASGAIATGTIGTAFSSLGRIEDTGGSPEYLDGQLDEVRIYDQVLSAAQVTEAMNATRPCSVTLDHYNISHAGSGVACDTHQITITAHDAGHNPVDAGARTLNLSTTNARGTWTGIAAGGGTLSDPTAGDGAATYTFAVGSNSVILNFRYANLAATSETFGFNANDGTYSENTGTAAGSEDPPFTLAQAGFRFNNVTDGDTTIPTQISGKPSNTGWNARTIRMQAIRTDTQTGNCAALFASQSRTVELGAECNSPATCAARQVSVNGGAIATSNDNGGAGAASYTGVNLAFNAASEADTVIVYPDAGQISLHARFDLDPDVAGYEGIGATNPFIVRPFGLAFPGISHANTATGTLLAAAGDPFSMTVQAYQCAPGEDADNDGVPDTGVNITDNGTVPNFAATAALSVVSNLPGGALGAVSRGVGCADPASIAMTGGAGAAADWCYSEAGNAVFSASVTNYLAAGVNIAGSSAYDGDANGGYIGRFKPKSFAVTGAPTLTNRWNPGCAPASSFTYLGEELTLGFTLEARNAQNGLTQNYTGAYAKLDLGSGASLGLGARDGVTNLTPRIDSALAPSGSFTNGVANLVVRTAVARATPDNPDGPFAAAQFGIAPNDADPDAAGGVQMGAFNLDVDGVGGNDHFAVGPSTALRFGRLRLQNAYGSATVALPMPLEVQYWGGAQFQINGDDSCTTLAAAGISLSGYTLNLGPGETAIVEATIAFASGSGGLTLSPPGAANNGSVLLTPDLAAAGRSYLRGRWGGATWDQDPSATAAFGLYGSQPKNFIFFRENY